jgi:hypothetical protein
MYIGSLTIEFGTLLIALERAHLPQTVPQYVALKLVDLQGRVYGLSQLGVKWTISPAAVRHGAL